MEYHFILSSIDLPDNNFQSEYTINNDYHRRVFEKACKLHIIGREAFVGIAMQELRIHHDAWSPAGLGGES